MYRITKESRNGDVDEGADYIMADTLIAGTTLVEKESRSIGDVPIGGIVAWAKSLTAVPNLAEGWVECDGAVLVDALSPLNGQTIPDLNGGIFLEGQATSGATGGSATMAHTHGGGAHTHPLSDNGQAKVGFLSGTNTILGDFVSTDSYTTSDRATNLTVTQTGGSVTQAVGLGGDTNSGSATTGGASNTENRPPFYTIVWIMRVR